MGTSSPTACKTFMIEDVSKQCRLHNWGDTNQWKQRFMKYKKLMSSMSDNINLPPSDRGNIHIPITSSLIAKKSNDEYIKNNMQCIHSMIKMNNDFIPNGSQTKSVSFFNLRRNHLINTENIINIIRSNAKPWICYDAKNKSAPESYIIFDLSRLEMEIRDKCLFARYKLRIKYQNFDFVGSKNMLKLIQSIKIAQETLNYEVWHSFDRQFESNIQRKRALTVIEDVIALLCSSIGNKNDDDDREFYYNDNEDDTKDDEKGNFIGNFMRKVGGKKYNKNEELWQFMRNKLKISEEHCDTFKLRRDPNSSIQRKIQLKHIQSLWNELVKRIDGEMTKYEDKCLICYEDITSETPITLECCGISLHYECLKGYIQSGFGNNGTRITLKQLSCLLCRNPMKHKAASDLFKDTQALYDKVSKIALKTLKDEGKFNDGAVQNRNGEYYNNPAGYAMKLYAFFLCYNCKEPYYFGSNQCGDDETENNTNPSDRRCKKCDISSKWIKDNTQQCPKCHRHIEKNGGCNHMTCRPPGGCSHEFCWLCLADWHNHGNCAQNRARRGRN